LRIYLRSKFLLDCLELDLYFLNLRLLSSLGLFLLLFSLGLVVFPLNRFLIDLGLLFLLYSLLPFIALASPKDFVFERVRTDHNEPIAWILFADCLDLVRDAAVELVWRDNNPYLATQGWALKIHKCADLGFEILERRLLQKSVHALH
jgi:hypothetical protein